ncbi:hypothetical protein PC120_g28680 [Phytophthora cactorum]|nr:hypothetical protein PC120_g28680 [Phytophthora cactorum]
MQYSGYTCFYLPNRPVTGTLRVLASILPEHSGQGGGPDVAFLDALDEDASGFWRSHALQVEELHLQIATVSVRSASPEVRDTELDEDEVA